LDVVHGVGGIVCYIITILLKMRKYMLAVALLNAAIATPPPLADSSIRLYILMSSTVQFLWLFRYFKRFTFA